ncbi:MAG TPA: LuxR C-terminal-related transcriptional regulator [Dehalococcoidia bacterium]|nr:LuxR C-terminal-related transcriptional regulator [Dehalococcoidia bacterium]
MRKSNPATAPGASFAPNLITADGLFAVDSEQRILEWSAPAERLTGLRAEAVIGRPCYEVLGSNGSRSPCRPHCTAMANARRRRPTPNFDIRLATGDQDATLNLTTLVAPNHEPGAPLVLHLLRDVTDQRNVATLLAAVHEPEGKGAPGQSAPSLSRRERQVIHLLGSGYSVPHIARSLGLSPITVRNHITRAMARLGARSRLEAVVQAVRLRLL